MTEPRPAYNALERHRRALAAWRADCAKKRRAYVAPDRGRTEFTDSAVILYDKDGVKLFEYREAA